MFIKHYRYNNSILRINLIHNGLMIIFDVLDVLTSLIIGKLLLDFSLDCVSLMNYLLTPRIFQHNREALTDGIKYNKQEESS